MTGVSGDTITLKSDAGVVATITVSDATRIVRAEPGQKDLSSATVIQVKDLTVGDRVLVRATPGSAENTYSAQAVIAMKKTRHRAEAAKGERGLAEARRGRHCEVS